MLSGALKDKSRTRKILVVDDEPDMLSIVSKSLIVEGYEIIIVNNGMECIDKAKSEHPDLILLDSVMPNMNGQTVLAKLKASQ